MVNSPLPKIKGQNVYRRNFIKADGRELLLYGYAPHQGDPLAQTDDPVAKGGELRWHPLRQEWNIYAPHRQNRTFKPSAAQDPLAPTKVGGRPQKFLLAILNSLFSKINSPACILKPPEVTDLPSLNKARALGHCDVIVYTTEGTGSLYTIGQDKRRLLLSAWTDRYITLRKKGLSFIMPFESRGEAVGVTLHHPHGQIYAFNYIPPTQKKMAEVFANGFDLVENMVGFGEAYTIAETQSFKAICPPYARFPYESWIVPTERKAGPWEFSEIEQEDFAYLLGDITRRYDALFDETMPYMLSLQAAPKGHEESWHFNAQFYPMHRSKGRVKYLASVEQATGSFTVDIMPEQAAEKLRAL